MSTLRVQGRRSGFTLIELLVAVAISAVIGGAIVSLMTGQVQLSATQNRNMINQESIRDALDYMADEISNTGTGVVEPFVSTATSSAFQFITDVNGDNSLPGGTWDRIRYDLSGSNLRRQWWTSGDLGVTWTLQASDTLLPGVSALSFTYYQKGNTSPASNDVISSVQINITQNPSTGAASITNGQVAVNSMALRVSMRNRLL